jgi:signal transduction histidine kinase
MGTSDDRSAGAGADASLRALSEFLTVNRAEILARWRGAVRRVQGEEIAAALADPVPALLDRLPSDAQGEVTSTEVLEQGPGGGEDLTATVTQLCLLREELLELWESGPRGGAAAVRVLDRAIDAAVLGAVMRASAARDRVGRALERLAQLQETDRERLVEGLLRVVLEEASAVDGAVLLVPDGDGLRVCAAVGVDAESARGRVIRAGDGFPGAVVAAGGALLARWIGDPLAASGKGARARAVFGVPVPDSGAPGGIAYVISLTSSEFPPDDRRLLQAAVERAAAVLESPAGAAAPAGDERLRIRDRALSTFAHDLRSPLGVVLMQAGVLLRSAGREEPPDRLIRRASTVQRSAMRIERLLAEYVVFHDLHRGTLELASARVAPADLVRAAVDGLRPSAEERRVVLEAELSPGLPPLMGDGARLQEALELLLRAALQVVPDGGRIALRAQHDDGGVVFSVEDSAPAIDPQELEGAFERAWVGDRLSIGRGGLGLAVAKGLVELHGGRIWATSTADGGNTFCFAIPAARA